MNKKNVFFTIMLLLIILFGISSINAEDTFDINLSDNNNDITIASNNDMNNGVIATNEYTVSAGSNSSTIQNTINQMQNGDVLNFENGIYTDICIYVDKNITLNGNGATLIGYQNPGVNNSNIPEVVRNTTATGGYAISQFATLYIINTNNTVINGFTLVGLNSTTYSNTVIYGQSNTNLEISNNIIEGSSWGLYMTSCPNMVIENNIIKNQATTGILSFGSNRAIIKNNTIINAVNHGIDVRHGTGQYVQVFNNTVIGAKEGIYIMHSKYQSVYNNTIYNSTISGITFYGAGECLAENNTFIGGRMAFLLSSGFYNITIGENTYKLANLPYPPTFVYYVGMAESPYQSATNVIGKYSEVSESEIGYESNITIPETEEIVVDYDSLLKPTGVVYTVPVGTSSEDIQRMIDGMNDGDTLKFVENGVYNDICIYVDKNIRIIGNNATLNGYSTEGENKENIPSKIWQTTSQGGYALSYFAVLYIINASNVVVSNLNINGNCQGYDVNNCTTTTTEYKSVDIFAGSTDMNNMANNITITNCTINGNSWGIFLQYCKDALISNNKVNNVYTTGIMNFGSARTIIINNTITNAVNHGIDVRHGTGPNVTVTNNIIIGAKEGIYLMHSKGHMVYNNTIMNSKLSGITCYGSGNESIFNNTITGSRDAILLGGDYYNVTIGKNSYNLDYLPFPPSFTYYIIQANSQYQSASEAIGTYSDISNNPRAVLITDDVSMEANINNTISATLKDIAGKGVADEELIFTIEGNNYTGITDENGVATVNVGSLTAGNYTVTVTFKGNENLDPNEQQFNLEIIGTGIPTEIISSSIIMYYHNGGKITATLVDKDGNPIANETIGFGIIGKTYDIATDENGTATLPINLKPGNYEVELTYNGNEKYDASKTTVTAQVLSTLSGKDITKYYKNGTQYQVKVLDSNGKALPNTKVQMNIIGKIYEIETNENGIATLQINLNPGAYIITTTNPNDGLMYSNNITVLSSIAGNDIVKYYRNGTQYSASFVDGQGNPLAHKNVTFNIIGKLYSIETDDNGIATLPINLNPGEYIVTAINPVDGLMYSNGITVLPTLICNDLTKKYGSSETYDVQVVDDQGNPCSGVDVEFNIIGKIYNLPTDSQGIAKLPINLIAGEYIVTAKDPNNGLYVSKTITVTS